MNEEELYKLSISDVPKYSLLNEILAIRDKRFPNEEVDYCINVNGYISLDVLNKYVRSINELEQLQKQYADLKEHYNNMFECHCNRAEVEQLQNNWNELKKWLEEQKEFIEDIPTFTLEITHNHFGMVGAYKNTLSKMQELENSKNE